MYKTVVLFRRGVPKPQSAYSRAIYGPNPGNYYVDAFITAEWPDKATGKELLLTAKALDMPLVDAMHEYPGASELVGKYLFLRLRARYHMSQLVVYDTEEPLTEKQALAMFLSGGADDQKYSNEADSMLDSEFDSVPEFGGVGDIRWK